MNNKILAIFLSLFLWAPLWGVMEFDGSDDYVEIDSGDTNIYEGMDAITISAWIYRKTDTGGSEVILDKYWDGTNRSIFFYVVGGVGDTLRFICSTDLQNDNDYAEGAVINVGSWYHVAGTWSSEDGYIRAYVNGTEGSSASQPGNTNRANDSPVWIGRSWYNATTAFEFDGYIDDVRIYNRALSASEIESLAKSRSRLLITDGLVGWWRLDEGEDGATAAGSNTALDRSGNGNHGTPTNSPIWRASTWINYP